MHAHTHALTDALLRHHMDGKRLRGVWSVTQCKPPTYFDKSFSHACQAYEYTVKKTKKPKNTLPQHNKQVYIIADFKWAKQYQMRRLSDCGESTLVHSSLHRYFCSLRFMDSPFLGSLSCFGQALAIVQMLHICLILQYIKKVCGWLCDGRI